MGTDVCVLCLPAARGPRAGRPCRQAAPTWLEGIRVCLEYRLPSSRGNAELNLSSGYDERDSRGGLGYRVPSSREDAELNFPVDSISPWAMGIVLYKGVFLLPQATGPGYIAQRCYFKICTTPLTTDDSRKRTHEKQLQSFPTSHRNANIEVSFHRQP